MRRPGTTTPGPRGSTQDWLWTDRRPDVPVTDGSDQPVLSVLRLGVCRNLGLREGPPPL
jgi:hypothetical protein